MQSIEIKNNIFWVGAVDWDVRDFHGYSTPDGSTYNAFLLKDEKTVLFDTVKKGFKEDHLKHLSQVIDPEQIDYIVVNHVEMDHTGCLPEIMEIARPEKLICSSQGKKALLAHFHREDWPYEVVKTGDEISTGTKTIKFIETRMLHWPDSMFSYIPEEKLLISQDAFGQHWATGERFNDQVNASELRYQAAKYYANILLPYSSMVERLLSEIQAMGLEFDMIAPDHGLIWRSNAEQVVDWYSEWCKQTPCKKALVVFDSMWRSTEMMAKSVADGLMAEGVSVRVLNLDVSHRADVMTELLDAKAVLLGSSTLNNGMLPRMADVLAYMKGLRPQGKIGAAFGSYGWGGEAVRLLNSAMEEMKIEVVDPGVRVNYVPTDEDLKLCVDLGSKVGKLI